MYRVSLVWLTVHTSMDREKQVWFSVTFLCVLQGLGKCRRKKDFRPFPLALLCLFTSFLVHCLCLTVRWSFTQTADSQAGQVGSGHHLTIHNIFFVLQIYPASLQLVVHAEGEELTLMLEKNEWVVLWFMLILSSCLLWPVGQRQLYFNVNYTWSKKINPYFPLWLMWAILCLRRRHFYCLDYDLVYSRQNK